MKKIISSRIDDLRKARDEWDEDFNTKRAKHEEEYDKYEEVRDSIFNSLADIVREKLNKFNLLDFEVYAQTRFGDGIELRVRCDENKKFDENSALSWNYDVTLTKDGEIVKESGSWSGLSATTPESIESLKQTVEALEYLNSEDWENLLKVELPKYEDYVKTQAPYYGNRPDFESQIKQAELEEFIGKDVLIKGHGIESLGYSQRADVWYKISRETPKKYLIQELTDHELQGYYNNDFTAAIEALKRYDPYQIKKEYLVDSLYYPFETIER